MFFAPNVAVIVDWALETTSLPCTGFNGNPKGIAILGCTLLFSRPLWLRYTGWLGVAVIRIVVLASVLVFCMEGTILRKGRKCCRRERLL